MNSNIHTLQSMKLNPPFETLLPNTVEFYKQELELHEYMITIATAFSTDKPKPDVDYGKLAATMPQITAMLEYIDQSLFKLTPIAQLEVSNLEDGAENDGAASRVLMELGNYVVTPAEEENDNVWGVADLMARQALRRY